MRQLVRVLALIALVASAGMTGPAPARQAAGLVRLDPGVGGLMSRNVSYLGTIPLDSPGVGGRMLRVGNQTRFYVTGAKGLTIYDVTNPAIPLVIGHLPVPHFQNEDVDVSDDGNRVIISADTVRSGIRVIDTSDPRFPREVGVISQSNHTTTCADPKCEWLYGSSGRIYDARNPAQIVYTGKNWGNGGHALNRDAAGIMVSDSNPRRVLDVSDPANPRLLATGTPKGPDGFLQHNNVRPRADLWVPRNPASPDYNDPTMRPGELLIGNSESNLTLSCSATAGGLSTWSMVNFDKGVQLKQLHTFRPRNGDYISNGEPPVDAGLGCSGHWFTERNNMVAAGWYEHGIRFFEIDPANGAIAQAGYFQPVATQASAAHWVADALGNEYVYSVDYARGVDILKFDRSAPRASMDEFGRSWLPVPARAESTAERFACRIAANG